MASLGIVGLVTGCAPSTAYMPLNSPPHPLHPRSPESVEIYETKMPTRPYVEVGLVQSESILVGGSSSMALLQALRAEGAKHGCDAIVINGENKGATAYSGVARESTSGFRAVCAVYQDGDAGARGEE